MNLLPLLRTRQADAEFDVAVWLDDHDRARKPVRFLAHHGWALIPLLIAALPLIAVVATAWAAGEFVCVIVRAHQVAGEGTVPCPKCLGCEADQVANRLELTFADVTAGWDLGDES